MVWLENLALTHDAVFCWVCAVASALIDVSLSELGLKRAFILFSFLISCLSSKYLLWTWASRIDSWSMHSEPSEDFCKQAQASSRWDEYYFLWRPDHSISWSQWSRKDNHHVSLYFRRSKLKECSVAVSWGAAFSFHSSVVSLPPLQLAWCTASSFFQTGKCCP